MADGGLISQGIIVKFGLDLSDLTSGIASAKSMLADFAMPELDVSSLTSGLTEVTDDAAMTSEAIAGIGGVTQEELDTATSGVSAFKDSLDTITSSVQQLSSNIGGVLSDRLNTFVGGVQSLASNIGNAVSGPINNLISGIQNIASNVNDAVSGPISSFTSGVQSLASTIGDAVSGPLSDFANGVQQVASNISDAASGALDTFISGVQNVASTVNDAVSGPLGNLVNGIQSVSSTIGDAVSGPINSFIDGIQNIASKVSDVVSGPINSFVSKVQDVASTVQDAASGAFSSFTSSIQSFADDISSAASGPISDFISGVRSMASAVQDAASGPISSFKANIQNAMSNVSSFASEAGGNAVSGISEFVGGLGEAGSSLLSTASDIGMTVMGLQMFGQQALSVAQNLLDPAVAAETMQTAFTTLLGSTKAATAEMQNLDAFASKTPFKTMDIDQAASQLIGFGTNAKDVVPDLTAIGDALSAVGKGTTANLDSIVNIFGKIQLGGKLTAGEMTQFSHDGVNAWAVMEQQTGKTQAQLTKMISAGLIPANVAIKDLTTGIEKNPLYAGGMAKQSATTAGLISTLQSNWAQMLASFGSPILKGLEPVLANIGNALASPVFKEFASNVGQGIVNAIKTFTSNSQIAIPVLSGLGAILAAVVIPAVWSLAAGVITATWPFILIGAAVAGLVAIFMHFYSTNAGFKSFIDNFVGGLKLAWTEVSTNFMPVMKQIGDVIQKNVMPVLSQIGGFLVSTFKPVWTELVTMWKTQIIPAFAEMGPILEPLKMLLGALGMIIAVVVVVALAALTGIIKGVIAGFAALLSGVIQAFGGVVQFVMGFITFISGIIAFFVDLFTGNFGKLGTDLQAILNGILNMLGGFGNVVMGLVGGLVMTVLNFFWGLGTGIWDFFVHLFDILVGHSIIPDMINGIVSWFEQLPGRALAFIMQLVDDVIRGFTILWNLAIGVVSNIIGGIIGYFEQLPGRITFTLNSMWNKAQFLFASFVTDALQFGSNIVKNIADGITGAIHFISDAIGGVTKWISDHLPHSPAKVGALRDLNLQGQMITQQISEGMLANMPKLNQALTQLTKPIAMSFSPNFNQSATNQFKYPASTNSQPIIINMPKSDMYIDGKKVTNALAPHQANAIRLNGNVRRQ